MTVSQNSKQYKLNNPYKKMKKRQIILIAFFVFITLLSFSVFSQIFVRPHNIQRYNLGDRINCCVQGIFGAPDSQCFIAESIEACREQGGAVQQCGVFDGNAQQQEFNVKNVTQYPRNFSDVDIETDPVLANLTEAIRSLGIYNRRYNVTTYNCVNFSSDLEIGLTALGFNATVTMISWGHALTDVHIGTFTIFIEPQTNASRRYNNDSTYTYLIPYGSLDYDRRNDSLIGVFINPPYDGFVNATEGRYEIDIYDSLAEAVRRGFRHRP